MARFTFRLTTLLKLRESTRDERRSLLAQAYRADELIHQQQQHVDEEMASLAREVRSVSGPGRIDVDRLLGAQRFELVLKAHRQHLGQQRRQVQEEIERRRQALVEADREVRVLEKLREKQLERWREEEGRRDVKRLDEAAQRPRAEEEDG